MSGPKTSDLSVEREMQARLQRARDRVTAAETNALIEIESLETEIRAYAKSRERLGDASQALERIASEAIEAVHAAANFDIGSDPYAAESRASRMASELDSIVTRAHRQMAPFVERIQRSKASEADSESATSFARFMKQEGACEDVAAALDALTAAAVRNADAASTGAIPRNASDAHCAPHASRTRPNPPASTDEVATLMGILEEARSIIMRAETLESDRAALSSVAREASKAAKDAAARGATLSSAEVTGLIAQARIIQSRMATQEQPLSRAFARIRALEAQLGSNAAARRPAFKDADAVYARLDALEAAVHARDEQRYIRACIDEVMREHGYDVVRSVDFSGNANGEHLVFAGASPDSDGTEATGIHAFFTPAGDMMLEVVGLRGESSGLEHDRMGAAENAAETQNLLAAQARFCAVYAEIADDLAKRGIVNKVVHRAAPDARHCKAVTFASGKTKGAQPSSKHATPGANAQANVAAKERGTKARAGARKSNGGAKYVTVPAKPSESRRRPAQKLHAREMR